MTVSSPDILQKEGLTLFQRGMYDQALAKFETAVTAYANNDNEPGQAEMLNNIGVIHRTQGNREAALDVLNQAEAIFARLGEYNQQGQALGNLGDLHAANRNRDEAARCYSTAISLFAQTNDPEKQSQVLRVLSLLRLRQGQWLAAMMRMEESLRVRPRISLPHRLFRGMLRLTLNLLGSG